MPSFTVLIHAQYVGLALFLSRAPNFHTKIGSGMASTKPAKAMALLPHPYPRASYILGANNGNKKAVKLCMN